MYQQAPSAANPAQLDQGKLSTLSQAIKLEMQQRMTQQRLRKQLIDKLESDLATQSNSVSDLLMEP